MGFCIADLPPRWREEAETLRRRGQEDLACMVESFVEDLVAEIREEDNELLTIAQAAAESGYSEEQLRRKVRDRELRAVRNGDRGHMRIRRRDVPRKLGHSHCQGDAGGSSDGYDVDEDARDIAERLGRQ
jgi:excisionase family DNA binding protein